jgi:hypothetical protein
MDIDLPKLTESAFFYVALRLDAGTESIDWRRCVHVPGTPSASHELGTPSTMTSGVKCFLAPHQDIVKDISLTRCSF